MVLLRVRSTSNNAKGNKQVMFCGITLCHGDNDVIIHTLNGDSPALSLHAQSLVKSVASSTLSATVAYHVTCSADRHFISYVSCGYYSSGLPTAVQVLWCKTQHSHSWFTDIINDCVSCDLVSIPDSFTDRIPSIISQMRERCIPGHSLVGGGGGGGLGTGLVVIATISITHGGGNYFIVVV